MIKTVAHTEYRRLRTCGLRRAVDAWSTAKVNVLFALLEQQGVVRLEIEPEEIPHDLSYVDTWGLTERQADHIKRQIEQRIECEGLWRMVIYVRCPCCGQRRFVDSVGDFIGEDWRDSGYDTELRDQAIEEAWRLNAA